MIEARGLGRDFGRVTAVRELDLSVEGGELFGLLGPDGAGKTTTIRLLSGILRPSRGTARILGLDVVERSLEVKRRTAWVADPPSLYDRLTGIEHVQLEAGLWGRTREGAAGRAQGFLELLGLEGRAEERVESYSRGTRQRLALASALALDPEVLFLDEPLSALDPGSARVVKDLLEELTARGVTVVLATRIMEIAEALCHRVGVLHQGEVVAHGTMDELRRRARADAAGSAPEASASSNAPGATGGEHRPTLEEVFLQVTGGEETQEMAKALAEG